MFWKDLFKKKNPNVTDWFYFGSSSLYMTQNGMSKEVIIAKLYQTQQGDRRVLYEPSTYERHRIEDYPVETGSKAWYIKHWLADGGDVPITSPSRQYIERQLESGKRWDEDYKRFVAVRSTTGVSSLLSIFNGPSYQRGDLFTTNITTGTITATVMDGPDITVEVTPEPVPTETVSTEPEVEQIKGIQI